MTGEFVNIFVWGKVMPAFFNGIVYCISNAWIICVYHKNLIIRTTHFFDVRLLINRRSHGVGHEFSFIGNGNSYVRHGQTVYGMLFPSNE